MFPSEYNEYECPECGEWVRVALPLSKYADCKNCQAKLEIHPDAEFEDGMWHDRTTLSVAVPGREHIQRMIDYAKRHEPAA